MKIVLSVAVVTAVILGGCSSEKQEEKVAKKEVKVVKEEATKVEIASSAIADVIEEVVDNAKDEVENVVSAVESKKDGIISSVAANVVEITEGTKEKVIAAADEVIAVASESTIDGEALYSSCKGCHGSNGEKKALNKSKIIQGWDAAKTADALNGYAAGTYGGPMKGIMKGQAAKLSADEITAVSDYISKL